LIDLATEKLIPLAQVPALLPNRRRGRKTHVSTVHRWATVGCRGIILETIQVGGTRCTTLGSLQAFFDELTRRASDSSAGVARPASLRPTARRLRDAEAAGRELDRLGF
jgi:hypothetical protein